MAELRGAGEGDRQVAPTNPAPPATGFTTQIRTQCRIRRLSNSCASSEAAAVVALAAAVEGTDFGAPAKAGGLSYRILQASVLECCPLRGGNLSVGSRS